MRIRTCLAGLSLLVMPVVLGAQEIPIPEKWDTTYVVILESNPVHIAPGDTVAASIQMAHIQYQLRLRAEGKASKGGPFGAVLVGDMVGMTHLTTDSESEARAIAENDPGVKGGHFKATVLPWLTPVDVAPRTSTVTPAEGEAIEEVARAFSAAYIRGDPEAMAEMYTEDAVIFPDQRPAIPGRDAIRRYWTLPANRRITDHEIIPDKLVVRSDIAYDHGRFRIAGTTDGVPWGPNWGKYVVVWKKGIDGKWRMYLDIWNRLHVDAPKGAEQPASDRR